MGLAGVASAAYGAYGTLDINTKQGNYGETALNNALTVGGSCVGAALSGVLQLQVQLVLRLVLVAHYLQVMVGFFLAGFRHCIGIQ